MNRVINEVIGNCTQLAGKASGSRSVCRQTVCQSTIVRTMCVAALVLAPGVWNRAAAQDQPSTGAPSAETAKPKASDTPEVELPYGFRPPAELPPEASSDSEWIVTFGDGSKRDLDTARRDFMAVFTRGKFDSDADRENFNKYVQWRLSQLTLKKYLTVNEEQQEIGRNRAKWISDVARARRAGDEVFNAYMQALVRETPELFKYHFVSRLNGAWILAELNQTEADDKNPAVPYEPAAAPLLAFLGQQHQLEGVRVPAVRGLARLIRDGQPAEKLRNDIITAFVTELQTGDPKHDVLPATIAEELGNLELIGGSDRAPVVVNALTQVLADKRRTFRVRCEAAAALGRLPLDNTINISLIAYEIAALAQELAQAFQEDAALAVENEQKPNYAAWKRCFLNLYVAFRGDTHRNILRKHGLMNKQELNATNRQSIIGAYNQVLPLVQAMLGEKEFDPKFLVNIQQWLQANVPQNRKVHDSFEEIISKDSVKLSETKSGGAQSQ